MEETRIILEAISVIKKNIGNVDILREQCDIMEKCVKEIEKTIGLNCPNCGDGSIEHRIMDYDFLDGDGRVVITRICNACGEPFNSWYHLNYISKANHANED